MAVTPLSKVRRLNQWGHRLTLLKAKLGFSTASLAEAMGVRAGQVDKWISGSAIPQATSVEKIEEIERKYAIRPDQDE